MRFHIPGMSCGGCARSVAAAIAVLDAQAKVKADTASRIISVASTASVPEVMKALDKAGYPAATV